jgi:hypothetical protein
MGNHLITVSVVAALAACALSPAFLPALATVLP